MSREKYHKNTRAVGGQKGFEYEWLLIGHSLLTWNDINFDINIACSVKDKGNLDDIFFTLYNVGTTDVYKKYAVQAKHVNEIDLSLERLVGTKTSTGILKKLFDSYASLSSEERTTLDNVIFLTITGVKENLCKGEERCLIEHTPEGWFPLGNLEGQNFQFDYNKLKKEQVMVDWVENESLVKEKRELIPEFFRKLVLSVRKIKVQELDEEVKKEIRKRMEIKIDTRSIDNGSINLSHHLRKWHQSDNPNSYCLTKEDTELWIDEFITLFEMNEKFVEVELDITKFQEDIQRIEKSASKIAFFETKQGTVLTTNLIIQLFNRDKRPYTYFTDKKLEEIRFLERKDLLIRSISNVVENSGNNICIVWNGSKIEQVQTLINILSNHEKNKKGRKIVLISRMPTSFFSRFLVSDRAKLQVDAPTFTRNHLDQQAYFDKFCQRQVFFQGKPRCLNVVGPIAPK